MSKIVAINTVDDIPANYRSTPVEKLLLYQNFDYPFETHTSAELLIGMCMDNRKSIRVPENFAYIIRSGGGNLRHSEFKVAYAIAIGGVRTIVLIAHNNCGMVNLISQKDDFIEGMVANAGWSQVQAEETFNSYAPIFEITNEIEFVTSETERLRLKYPKIAVCPLFYNVDDNKLSVIETG